MKNYSALLETKLTQLPFSKPCLRWFSHAGVHTVEDTEEHITLLLQSKYYTKPLLHEMTTVIRAYMDEEIKRPEPAQQIADKQKQITKNNNIIRSLIRMIAKRNVRRET